MTLYNFSSKVTAIVVIAIFLASIPTGILKTVLELQWSNDYQAVPPSAIQYEKGLYRDQKKVLVAARWQQYEDLYYNSLIYQQNHWQNSGLKDRHFLASLPGAFTAQVGTWGKGFDAPWQQNSEISGHQSLYEMFAGWSAADHQILTSAISLVMYAIPQTTRGMIQTKAGQKRANVVPDSVKNSPLYQQGLTIIRENLDRASPPIALAFYHTDEVIEHLVSGYSEDHWFSYAVILGADAQARRAAPQMKDRALLQRKKQYFDQHRQVWGAAIERVKPAA